MRRTSSCHVLDADQDYAPVACEPVSPGPYVAVTPLCGLRADGTVTCWAPKQALIASELPSEARFTQLVGIPSGEGLCGLGADGRVTCWGYTDPPPASLQAKSIAVGPFGTGCAVRDAGDVVCWGQEGPYQLGSLGLEYATANVYEADSYGASRGEPATVQLPVTASDKSLGVAAVTGPIVAREVTTPEDTTCVVRPDGASFCWGDVSGMGPSGLHGIDAGGDLVCGRDAAEGLRCWGPAAKEVPAELVGAPVASMSVGDRAACVSAPGGQTRCFGWNFGHIESPLQGLSSLAVGTGFACGLDPAGKARCWGADAYEVAKPKGEGKKLVNVARFSSLSFSDTQACGITIEGAVACWGVYANANTSGTDFVSVSPGSHGGCALRTSGEAVCWGSADLEGPNVPAGPFRELEVSGAHACAVRGDDTLVCWGRPGRLSRRVRPAVLSHGLDHLTERLEGECKALRVGMTGT